MNDIKSENLDIRVLSSSFDELTKDERPSLNLIRIMQSIYEMRDRDVSLPRQLSNSDIFEIHAEYVTQGKSHVLLPLLEKYLGNKGYAISESKQKTLPIIIAHPIQEIKQKEVMPKITKPAQIPIADSLLYAVINVGVNFLVRKESNPDSKWYFPGGQRYEYEVHERAINRLVKSQTGLSVALHKSLGKSKNGLVNLDWYSCRLFGKVPKKLKCCDASFVPRKELFSLFDTPFIKSWSKDVLCHLYGGGLK